MGGQTGDSGSALVGGRLVAIVDTVKDKAGRHLHRVAEGAPAVTAGLEAELSVDLGRRRAISRHHSATHLLHWALRKVLGTHIRQAGTHKTAERLRFDFSHFEAVTPAQLKEVERLVNEKVIDNSSVGTYEVEFDKKPADTLAFFGDKYGKIVRVVDIGGFSRELGGTHVATTGEIGFVKVVHESAIAAGTRRIEAVAGKAAQDFIAAEEEALAAVNAHLSSGPTDIVRKLESLLAQKAELERKLKAFEHKGLRQPGRRTCGRGGRPERAQVCLGRGPGRVPGGAARPGCAGAVTGGGGRGGPRSRFRREGLRRRILLPGRRSRRATPRESLSTSSASGSEARVAESPTSPWAGAET